MADRTCIVVADGSDARLFSVNGSGEWKLLAEIEYPAGRAKSFELVTDLVTKDENPREHESARFARQLADLLHKWSAQNVFTNLILVSPPKFLGVLRGSLHRTEEKMIVEVLAKDLTRVRADELEERIPAFV